MKRNMAMSRYLTFVGGLAALLLGLTAEPALATTYWVTNGVGSEAGLNGLSAPFFTISNAVAHASPGDTITVSNGTYLLSATITIPTKTNLTIQGFSLNPADVIVDGQNTLPCFDVKTNCTLQYLTIQNGFTNATSTTAAGIYIEGSTTNIMVYKCNLLNHKGGAAVYPNVATRTTLDSCNINYNTPYGGRFVSAGFVTVTNCTFIGNSNNGANGTLGPALEIYAASLTGLVVGCTFLNNTNNGPNASGFGGAIYGGANTSNTIRNCAFVGNCCPSSYGGAVYLNAANGLVVGCGFTNNFSYTQGGALYAPVGFLGTIASCSFASNYITYSGGYAGALNLLDGTVSNCLFFGNMVTNNSGAAMYGAAIGIHSGCKYPVMVTDCIFSNNAIMGGNSYSGGTIWMQGSTTGTVQRSLFVGNVGTNGAFYEVAANGIGNTGTYWTVRNCGFFGNSALYGGAAISTSATNLVVDSCTFAMNKDTVPSSSYRGAIYFGSSNTTAFLTNCIVYSNFYNNTTAGDDIYFALTNANSITFQNCCLFKTNGLANVTTLTVNNCTTNNPLFRDGGTAGAGTSLLTGTYDFRLQKGSPCIDKGTNELSWMTGAIDLAGTPRVRGLAVDIGCYEYLAPPVSGTSIFFR